jgi:hypothetical protein
METIEPTIVSFLDTYTFFKKHEDTLQTKIHPFNDGNHGVYNEFNLKTVKDSIVNLYLIRDCADRYVEEIGLPPDKQECKWNSRTSNQAARNVTEMLNGAEHWPPCKIAYAMKALQNAELVSTPEPLVLTQLKPQTKSE